MDTLENIKCFIAVVRTGNFSAAARELGTVPSLVTKRIRRLEDQLDVKLFNRTTRKVELTFAGERYYPKFLRLIAEADNALRGSIRKNDGITGAIRVKSTSSLSAAYTGAVVARFVADNPGVKVELVLQDRSVNPVEDGLDIAIGATAGAFHGVTSTALCPLTRKLVASRDYLDRNGWPAHPRDLLDHDCLAFQAIGNIWNFEGVSDTVSIEVHPRFTTSDSAALVEAARRGAGIAQVATYAVKTYLDSGELVEALPHFRVQAMMLKAHVPERRMRDPAVRLMLTYLVEACQPAPPWDR